MDVAVNKVILAQDRASGPVKGAAVVGMTGLALRLAPCSEGCAKARRLPNSGLEAGRYSGSAPVAVVEATGLGLGHDPPLARWLYFRAAGERCGRGTGGAVSLVRVRGVGPKRTA